MKKYLAIILILFCATQASAQGGWIRVNNSYGAISNRGSFDSAFLFPTGCGAPTSLGAHDLHKMALYGDSCNNKLYIYNPKTSTWTISGGGGVDSGAAHLALNEIFTGAKRFDTAISFYNAQPDLIRISFGNRFLANDINKAFTSLGYQAGNFQNFSSTYPDGYGNTWVGNSSGVYNVDGYALTGVGVASLYDFTGFYYLNHSTNTKKGADMTFMGYNSGAGILSGANSIGVGNEAGYKVQNLKNSTILGSAAYMHTAPIDSSQDLTLVGTASMKNSRADSSVALGSWTGNEQTINGGGLAIIGDYSGVPIGTTSLYKTTIIGHHTFANKNNIVALGSLGQNVIIGNNATTTDNAGVTRGLYSNDTGDKLQVNGSTYIRDNILIGTTSLPTGQVNGAYIVAQTPTDPSGVSRGLNVESHYSGTYASTGIQSRSFIEGTNNQDHNFAVQAWPVGNSTGTTNKVAAYMGTGTINSGTWTDFYGFYYPGVTGAGTVTNAWSFFTEAPDPAYISGKLGISNDRLSQAQIKYPFFVSQAFGEGSYGITTPQAGVFSNSTAANGTGGVIALGGKSGLGNDPYPFAFIKGSPESVGSTYAGQLDFYTGSGGDNAWETNSGSYNRMHISSTGNINVVTPLAKINYTTRPNLTAADSLAIYAKIQVDALLAGKLGLTDKIDTANLPVKKLYFKYPAVYDSTTSTVLISQTYLDSLAAKNNPVFTGTVAKLGADTLAKLSDLRANGNGMPDLMDKNYDNDSLAVVVGGIGLGKFYRTGNLVKIVVTLPSTYIEDLTFTAVQGTFSDSSGVWSGYNGSGPDFRGFGVATKSIAAGNSGSIQATYTNSTAINSIICLTSDVTLPLDIDNLDYKIIIDSSGNYIAIYGNYVEGISTVPYATGDMFRLNRVGGVVSAEYYRSGAWTNIYTFTHTTTSKLYLVGATSYGAKLFNPKGTNLQ